MMEYIVRVAGRIDGELADDLSRAILQRLLEVDASADMAHGPAGVYAFWTSVVEGTIQDGIAVGAERVRVAIQQAINMNTGKRASGVHALSIEAYPADESAELALL